MPNNPNTQNTHEFIINSLNDFKLYNTDKLRIGIRRSMPNYLLYAI